MSITMQLPMYAAGTKKARDYHHQSGLVDPNLRHHKKSKQLHLEAAKSGDHHHRKRRWQKLPHLKTKDSNSSGMSSSAVSSPGLVDIDGLFCKCICLSVFVPLQLHYEWNGCTLYMLMSSLAKFSFAPSTSPSLTLYLPHSLSLPLSISPFLPPSLCLSLPPSSLPPSLTPSFPSSLPSLFS